MAVGGMIASLPRRRSGERATRALIAFLLFLAQPAAAGCEEKSPQPAAAVAAPAKCLEAAVNPVTGDAICINPHGAPVERPPASALKPCKPRAHDQDPWTTYEHWSGC